MRFIKNKGTTILISNLLSSIPGIIHGMSTRQGGVSSDSFSSLNLSFKTGDFSENIRINRERFAQAIGGKPEKLVVPDQIHMDRVVRIVTPSSHDEMILADAFITDVADITLAVSVADCVPVLICDPVNMAVAAVHAGWRGTVLRIVEKTLQRMNEEFNTDPIDCVAAIGPSIGPCCYEIGPEVATNFDQNLLRTVCGERIFLDLWRANLRQLVESGVRGKNIDLTTICTFCHDDTFFSYRASGGITGRMLAAIGIKRKT